MTMAPPKSTKLHILMIPHKGTGGSGVRSASADTKPKTLTPPPAGSGGAPPTEASLQAAAAGRNQTNTTADGYHRLVSTASKRSCSSADARLKVKEFMQKPPSIPPARGGKAVSKMTPAYINEFWQKRENVVRPMVKGSAGQPTAAAVNPQEKENVPSSRVASASRTAPVIAKPGLRSAVTKIESKKVTPSPAPLGTNVPRSTRASSPSSVPVAARRPSPAAQVGRPLSPSPSAKPAAAVAAAAALRKPSPKPTDARLSSPSRTLTLSPAAKKTTPQPAAAAGAPAATAGVKRPVLVGRKVVVGSSLKPKPKPTPKHADPAAAIDAAAPLESESDAPARARTSVPQDSKKSVEPEENTLTAAKAADEEDEEL